MKTRPTRHRPRRRLAAVLVVLLLAAVAFVAVAGFVASVVGVARSAPATSTTTKVLSPAAPAGAGYDPVAAGPPATDTAGQWLPDPAHPGWTLTADTLQQHFLALCRQLAAANVPGKQRARARLVRQWNADVHTAAKAGWDVVRVANHPASIRALQRDAGGRC